MTPWKLSVVTVSTTLALATVAGPALAHESEVAELEARVAALEAQLEALLANRLRTRESPAARQEASAVEAAEHSYSFGGYIKLDAMWSDYSDGDLEPGSPGSQFYIPATIPVDGSRSEGPEADMQGRESRINFKSKHRLANGGTASTFVELDFFVGPGGNERVSNSYNPRLRHAFVKYDDWLFGQTWSTFQDVGALPENIDFIGPSESTAFVRQAQVRYTKGPWEFAIENPETTVTPFGGGERIVADDGGIPDFVTRYTATLGDGYLKAAMLFRQLSCEAVGVDDTETGLGISVSGKHMIGRDDIRWMATWGRGTGRYLGLNTANGAVLDENGDLEAIDQLGAFVSYRHFWSDRWRSNLTYGYLSNDHDVSLTGVEETGEVHSIHANLLFEPVPSLTLASEILFAERTLESGASGDMTRLLLSAKYAF